MAKSNPTKTILIVSASILAVIIISALIFHFVQKSRQSQLDKEAADAANAAAESENKSPGSTTKSVNTSTALQLRGNDFSFYWDNPAMRAKEVQWIQNGYNQLAKKINLKPGGSTWPIIGEDGVFGEKTHNAVKKINGLKGSTSVRTNWTDFKKKLTELNSYYFPGTKLYDESIGSSTAASSSISSADKKWTGSLSFLNGIIP